MTNDKVATRQVLRKRLRDHEFERITSEVGGELRKRRRAMARDSARRLWRKDKG
jgi:hypothetical protein